MALIQTTDSSELYQIASSMGRGENFGYNGWRAIGNYLEELSDDTGEDVEIDIIAICCEYSMAESAKEFYMEFSYKHGIDLPTMEGWEDMDDDEKLGTIQDYLQENTSVVICEYGCIIWKAF